MWTVVTSFDDREEDVANDDPRQAFSGVRFPTQVRCALIDGMERSRNRISARVVLLRPTQLA